MTDPCPYTVGKRTCTAGPRGHAGPHQWPPRCGRLHLGYACTLVRGHDGLHQSRYADGTLMHSWAPRKGRETDRS